jgi:hypothetical protein
MNNKVYPTTEAGWLHLLDMEKTEAWQQGYAQGLKRAEEKAKERKQIELRGDLLRNVDAVYK